MAIRNIVMNGDPILRKKCRQVDKFDDRLAQLIDDMFDTMRKASGVGLAAPQVGLLKRVVVIDIGDGPIELVNPVLVKTAGKQIGNEGCLSFPNDYEEIERPNYAKVKAFDRNGNKIIVEGTGLKARALCHELDHLDGVLFIDLIGKHIEE